MSIWGVAIPGLGMAAGELPALPGLLRLDNPEIGSGAAFDGMYTLEDVAARHAAAIGAASVDASEAFWVIGMSMGGMIAAILASTYRPVLPPTTRFLFLVTSANLPGAPAVSAETLAGWQRARPGDVGSWSDVMGPFFGASFRGTPEAEAYFAYRAAGENGQSPRAFMRQVTALRAFDGARHFGALDGARSWFIGGGADEVLGPRHNADLKRLAPGANHQEWAGVGHMINLERPAAFDPRTFVR